MEPSLNPIATYRLSDLHEISQGVAINFNPLTCFMTGTMSLALLLSPPNLWLYIFPSWPTLYKQLIRPELSKRKTENKYGSKQYGSTGMEV